MQTGCSDNSSRICFSNVNLLHPFMRLINQLVHSYLIMFTFAVDTDAVLVIQHNREAVQQMNSDAPHHVYNNKKSRDQCVLIIIEQL